MMPDRQTQWPRNWLTKWVNIFRNAARINRRRNSDATRTKQIPVFAPIQVKTTSDICRLLWLLRCRVTWDVFHQPSTSMLRSTAGTPLLTSPSWFSLWRSAQECWSSDMPTSHASLCDGSKCCHRYPDRQNVLGLRLDTCIEAFNKRVIPSVSLRHDCYLFHAPLTSPCRPPGLFSALPRVCGPPLKVSVISKDLITWSRWEYFIRGPQF